MTRAISISLLLAAVFASRMPVASQSGGSYDLSHNVIAGGGAHSTGGTYDVTGTVGQPQAGTVSGGGNYDLRGGFWAFQALAPTAAPVSITGRVRLANGTSMSRVRITLVQLDNGAVRQTRPSPLGYYQFDDVEIGSYVVRAEGGGYQFTPPEMFINLLDNLLDVDFEGLSP
jgi:hypothetical protein